jgi:hypothetical protein
VSKRVSLCKAAPDDESARLADHAKQIQQARTTPDDEKYVVVTVNIPLGLIAAMREAAGRRQLRQAREHPKGKGGRASVSAIITEILLRHRDEIEGIG